MYFDNSHRWYPELKEYKGVKLGQYLGEGNSRACYINPKDEEIVIKVPKTTVGEKHSRQEYERSQDNHSEIAPCHYYEDTGLLYMERMFELLPNDNPNGPSYGLDKEGRKWIYDLNGPL